MRADPAQNNFSQNTPMFGVDVVPTFIKEFQQDIFVEGVHTGQGHFLMSKSAGFALGTETIPIPYSYSNPFKNTKTDGFHIFNSFYAFGDLGCRDAQITCCDSDGGYLNYDRESRDPFVSSFFIEPSQFEQGFVNTGSGYISGKTYLWNNKIISKKIDQPRVRNDVWSMEEDVFRLHLGDGTQRIYRRAKNPADIDKEFSFSKSFQKVCGFIFADVRDTHSFTEDIIKSQNFAIQAERKPNGNWVEYSLDEDKLKFIPTEIKTWDSKKQKVLSWIKVESAKYPLFDEPETHFAHYRVPMTVTTSDGNEIRFICVNIGEVVNIPRGNIVLGQVFNKRTDYQTQFDYYPQKDEKNDFPVGPLRRIVEPQEKVLELTYYEKNPHIPVRYMGGEPIKEQPEGFVKSIKTPRGIRWFEYYTKQIIYNDSTRKPYSYRNKDIHTNVYEHDSKQAIRYCFTDTHRLNSVEYYTSPKQGITENGGRELIYLEKFYWERQGRLGFKSIRTKEGTLGDRFFRYDGKGNVAEESLYGNLSGKKAPIFEYSRETDAYIKKCTYSQDGFNNMLSIEETNGTKKTFRYKENTDLLEATFHWHEGKIVLREFRFYDTAAILIKQIVDDGSSEDVENLSSVTRRMVKNIFPKQDYPAFGQPEAIESRYLDLRTHQYRLLQRVEFTYDQSQKPISVKIIGENGKTISKTYVYDARGNLIREIDPMGSETLYAYDRANRLVQTTIPSLNYVFKVKYNPNDQIVEEETIENGIGYVKKHEYTPEGYKIAEIDENGNKTCIESEFKGRPNKIILPQALDEKGTIITPILHQTFDAMGNLIEKRTPNGEVVKAGYTLYNKPIFIEYPDSTREEMTYFLDGKLKTKKTKTGAIISYTYDWQGRLVSEEHTDPNLRETRQTNYEYTAFHKAKKINTLGEVTHYEYDGANRLIKKSKKSGKVVEYLYDSLSRKTQERVYSNHQLEHIIKLTYDDLNRITKKTVLLPDGKEQLVKNYTFDCLGRCIEESYDHKFTTYKKYDIFNRITEEKNAANQTTTYTFKKIKNTIGQTVDQHIIQDPEGKRSIKTFDALERLVLEEQYFHQECLSKREYTYDINGNLIDQIETVISQRGPPKTFIVSNLYAPGAQLIQQTEAKNSLEKITKYTYNNQGLLSQKIKPDENVIEYIYNAFGETIQERTLDGSLGYTYQYDKLGNLTHVYDKEKQLINECHYQSNTLCQENFANGLVLKKSLDPLKRITQMQLPDGSKITYSYSGLFLSKIERNGYTFEHFDYQTSGRLWSYRLPSGKWADHLHNTKTHNLTDICTPFYKEELFYNRNHYITEIAMEDHFGTNTQKFSYDPLGQLASESGLYTHTYVHDSLNNRLLCDANAFNLNDLNQITETSDGVQLEYDLNGNLISKTTPLSTTHLTYDVFDRLTQLYNHKKHLKFTYDHTHRRMFQTTYNTEDETTKTMQFFYDQDMEIGAFENDKMTQFKLTATVPSKAFDIVFAIEIDNVPYLVVQNAQGSIVSLAKLDNTPIQSYRYSAFGEKELLTSNEKTVNNPWTYQSKREILEFYAFDYRDYDPHTGRFLTPDPTGFADGSNLYAFTLNSPLSFVDPYGLFIVDPSGRRINDSQALNFTFPERKQSSPQPHFSDAALSSMFAQQTNYINNQNTPILFDLGDRSPVFANTGKQFANFSAKGTNSSNPTLNKLLGFAEIAGGVALWG
ncbi:MAG: putative deoxyribonuclease RhsC, partial [Chlamydiae bacterium]|nr:putative deoxyribonuclease RhsC [Chlamydiota bacterium]